MPSPFLFGRSGLLPIAAPLLAFIAVRLGALLFPSDDPACTARDRAVSGALSAVGLAILGTRLFGLLHLLTPLALFSALLICAAGLAIFSRRKPFAFPWRAFAPGRFAALFLGALFALGASLLAADWLPIWQWDSLGYHLPYVNFALAAHATRGVPDGAPYIGTYPHDIELFMVALRALLPDDRLVDMAQIPFAILAAIACAGIARKSGAERSSSLGAGAAFLVVPAVFLQMPTNYVDIGCAALLLSAIYFLLPETAAAKPQASRERTRLMLFVLAVGLHAGSKPNAPIAAGVLSLAALFAHRRSKNLALLLGALSFAALFASEAFISTAIHHGNPLWPARIDLGPIHLPGKNPLHELLESGLRAPQLHGPLLWRVIQSWTSLTSPPICDMRYGGMGPLFLAAIIPALVTLWKRRDLAWVALLATIAVPDPAIARYILALPALVFALAAPRLDSLESRGRTGRRIGLLYVLVISIGAVWQLTYAWPGLTGEGPTLAAYAGMTEAERLVAVGADGRPVPYIEARKRIANDETFAFDAVFDLPYLAWESDARYRVVFIPAELREGEVEAFLRDNRVRVLVASDASELGRWLAAHPALYQRLLRSNTVPCSMYARVAAFP